MDDPDARLEAADPIAGPLPQVQERRKPSNPRAPYHQALDPDHEDELLLAIGQGLALLEASARHSPEATVLAIAGYADALRAGKKRPTRDPTDTALALACLFGHQICRELSWGWGHLRRIRSPGIVLISPDHGQMIRPRRVVDHALRDGGGLLVDYFQRLRDAPARPRGGALYAPWS